MNLIAQLQQKLVSVLANNQQAIVVAYSGGVDSHVLLHCLHTLRAQGLISNPLSAIHIHHGLSPNADSWLQHCQQICQDLAIPLQAAKVKVNKQNRQSLEAVARTVRYAKIAELAPVQALVLLAQHQDDQLETVLLQLKRGAGPKGLAGMAELAEYVTETDKDKSKTLSYFRPLLNNSQAEIVAYAHEQQLQWIEDESNQNIDFERNFLRHKVLPALIQKWPELAKTASRSAQLCGEQQLLLEEVSLQKLAAMRAEQHSLHIAPLLNLSTTWLHQLVRTWLTELGIPAPSQAVLHKLKPELLMAKIDASPVIQWANWQFRRFDDRLFVIPVVESVAAHKMLWQGQGQIKLPEPLGILQCQSSVKQSEDGSALLFVPEAGELKIHFGGYGQRFKPANIAHSKPLKQWYKEWKIPPWQRDKIALFLQDGKPLALLIDGVWLLSQQHQDSLVANQSASFSCMFYQP
ncbi:tRNA lysidine(34) synthetase TilS [Paraglaciecola sp.]|uniref:tRNA lysidine(34) synthetase TilS n=1 Tax=Paraglaciecola sp. TaxID=1920173 RepID=UPI0030F3BF9A